MKTPDEMQAEWSAAIAAAGAMTEAQMRDSEVPRLETVEALADYVRTLIDRPHDYGTCVYAMSMAAVAAFNLVAGRLSVTGFQASCADLDILSRTRGFKWGRLVNYEDLLYPQYCDDDHFPPWRKLVEDNKDKLADQAAKLLLETEHAADSVNEHWGWLVSLAVKPDAEVVKE